MTARHCRLCNCCSSTMTPSDLELCLKGLKKSGLDFQAATASTREDFDRALREKAFDIVVSDYRMKGWTGIDALAMVNRGLSRASR